MTTYSIRTNFKDYSQSIIDAYLLEDIINSFKPGVWDFLVLSPDKPVQGSIFLQVGAPDKSDNKYVVETVIKTFDNQYKMHRYHTDDKKLVLQYLTDYLEKQQVPDISGWDDVTHENPNFK